MKVQQSIWSLSLLMLFVAISASPLMAQKKKKDKEEVKKEEVKTDVKASNEHVPNKNGLSYNFGILIATSLQMQGIPTDSINSKDLIAGMEAVLKKQTTEADVNKAQEVFTQKVQEAQAKAESAQSEIEKSWFDENGKKKGIVTLPSGIQYEVLKEGNGAKPSPTSKVMTHYHGTLTNGTIFDSSVQRGEPATFPVNGVIKGWQEILVMMPVGSKWRVYIPSALAYGSRAMGSIPANSILIFEIELIKIEG